MTKSTITRERLEALANAEYCKSNPGAWLLGLKELNELARMALAAMDIEPVAEITEDLGRLFVKIHHPTTLKAGDKLYRHAQPDISHLSRICAECTHVWYHGKKYNGKKRSHCLRCGKVEYQLEGNLVAPEVECPHEWVAYGMSKDKGTGVFATLCRCRLCGLRSRAGVIEPLQEVQQEIKS